MFKLCRNSFRQPVKRAFLSLILVLSVFFLSSCSFSNKSRANYISDTKILLDTFVTITLYGCSDTEILNNCFEIVSRYQDIYSRTLNYTELYNINQSREKRIPISEEMADILNTGKKYGEKTNGAFDLTVGAVTSLWDFKTEPFSLPSEDSLKSGLKHVNFKNISIVEENGQHFLIKENENAVLELGGIAKGYIADKIKSYLISEGVGNALIDLGGNILCIGGHTDGTPFHVGILRPFSENQHLAVVDVADCSVVTSGSYQRYFKIGDRLYHHILDPSSGYPVENGLLSVTIISKSSVDADALSTSCFILGREKGLELIDSLEDTYGIFVDEDLNITYSKGLKENFSVTIPSPQKN